jgi:hypothetical protein
MIGLDTVETKFLPFQRMKTHFISCPTWPSHSSDCATQAVTEYFIFIGIFSILLSGFQTSFCSGTYKVGLGFLRFFFNSHSGGWSPNWVHSARRPLIGLLYLPRMIVKMENLVEWMAGETEVLGENLPRRHFFHNKSHLTRPGIEPWPPRWEASD